VQPFKLFFAINYKKVIKMRTIDTTDNKLAVGATYLHTFTVLDADNALVADPTLALSVEHPDGSTTSHAIGDGTLTATTPAGTYSITLLTALVGDYFVQIQPTRGDWYTIYVPVGE
jgi:hypothetical protein